MLIDVTEKRINFKAVEIFNTRYYLLGLPCVT